jgi:hypothetical protein
MNLFERLLGKRACAPQQGTVSTDKADADFRTWPEPQLVPYRAVVVFSGCYGEVCMEPSVQRKLMLPAHAISAIYDGEDPDEHREPVLVIPSGEMLDGRAHHIRKHTHLLRGWTRDWTKTILVDDAEVTDKGLVARVPCLMYTSRKGGSYYGDVASNSVCGVALEDGRLFYNADWWQFYLEKGCHYADCWDYLLESAREAFAPKIDTKDQAKKAS